MKNLVVQLKSILIHWHRYEFFQHIHSCEQAIKSPLLPKINGFPQIGGFLLHCSKWLGNQAKVRFLDIENGFRKKRLQLLLHNIFQTYLCCSFQRELLPLASSSSYGLQRSQFAVSIDYSTYDHYPIPSSIEGYFLQLIYTILPHQSETICSCNLFMVRHITLF